MSRKLSTVSMVLLALAAPPPATWAVSRDVVDKLAAGNTHYANGEFQQALDAYAVLAADVPNNPELAYNEGLALYRLRDFARAGDKFNEAIINTRDLGLEARAKFNLGNVAYSQALEKMSNLQEAIDHARNAIRFYRDALELDAKDHDARTNIEIAQLFIKDLIDKQKQQQEQQQQNQDQHCDNPQQQDQNQNQNQQEQQQEQQKEQSQNQDQQEQDQEQQQQDQSQKDEDEQQEQQQQGQGEQNKDDEQQQQQSADQNQSEGQQDQNEEQQASAQETRELTPQEAERMLQAVRDKEAKRREELAERTRAKRVRVQKDW